MLLYKIEDWTCAGWVVRGRNQRDSVIQILSGINIIGTIEFISIA